MFPERRKESRLPLDDICYVRLAEEGGEVLPCALLDASPHGARIGLPPECAGVLKPGTIIWLHVEKPCPDMDLGHRRGEVAWANGPQAGLSFLSNPWGASGTGGQTDQ